MNSFGKCVVFVCRLGLTRMRMAVELWCVTDTQELDGKALNLSIVIITTIVVRERVVVVDIVVFHSAITVMVAVTVVVVAIACVFHYDSMLY